MKREFFHHFSFWRENERAILTIVCLSVCLFISVHADEIHARSTLVDFIFFFTLMNSKQYLSHNSSVKLANLARAQCKII